jgi:hypothetical protein
MLSDFITQNRSEILKRSRARVANRSAPRPTDEELENGISQFLDQLIKALPTTDADVEFDENAAKHGADLLRMGFSIAQVVHDYGDVCQTITELALEQDAPISTADSSGHLFSVDQVDAELEVDADRPLLAAAYLVDTQIGARSQPESGPRAA